MLNDNHPVNQAEVGTLVRGYQTRSLFLLKAMLLSMVLIGSTNHAPATWARVLLLLLALLTSQIQIL